MRGMWAAVLLYLDLLLHGRMAMIAIKRMGIEAMAVWVLQSQVLVEHGVAFINATQVKTALRCQGVVLMAMVVAVSMIVSMAEVRTVID